MWKLVIEDDEGKRTVVPLTRETYTIGRKEGNTIRLTERNVSRDHARLMKRNGVVPPGFVLEDCTSYNGVYVNGLRVAQSHDLSHGDLIQIGDYRIVLQDDTLTEESGPPLNMTEDMKATMPTGIGVAARASLLLERPNRLVMLAGPTPGAEYPLDRERLSVGRTEEASISINHNSVSRMHCEIHALGEGRFEIVDKGSSNGVRVNGSDLRRGIIEAGDVIELGDVRFKFVGAGQVFVPGVNDSQQLEAINNRASAQRGSTGFLPFLVFGMLLSGIVFGVWMMHQRRIANDTPVPSASVPSDPALALLGEAKRVCDMGDCETAHGKILEGIAAGSPLRDSDDFKLIEVAWADGMLAKAEREVDVTKKREILHEVEQADTVDATRRKLANDRLQALDEIPQPTPHAPRDSGAHTSTTSPTPTHEAPHTTPVETQTAPAPTTPTATHTAKPVTPTPTGPSALEKARALVLDGDANGAKQVLLQKVAANPAKATHEELYFLKKICSGLHDQECVKLCDRQLGNAP